MKRGLLVGIGVVALAELLACGGTPPPPTSVAFVGILIKELFTSTEQSAVIGGADVFVTSSSGTLLGQNKTNTQGNFAVGDLPKNINASLVFSDSSSTPTFVRSVFPGQTAGYDTYLFYGAVYEAAVPDIQSLVAEYATAVGVNTASLMTFPAANTSTAGAAIIGRVVTLITTPQGSLEYQDVKGATIKVSSLAGKNYRVIYRGDRPAAGGPGPIEPLATSTGDDSFFVAFGINATGGTSLPFPSTTVNVEVTTSSGTFTQGTLVVQDGVTQLDNFSAP